MYHRNECKFTTNETNLEQITLHSILFIILQIEFEKLRLTLPDDWINKYVADYFISYKVEMCGKIREYEIHSLFD